MSGRGVGGGAENALRAKETCSSTTTTTCARDPRACERYVPKKFAESYFAWNIVATDMLLSLIAFKTENRKLSPPPTVYGVVTGIVFIFISQRVQFFFVFHSE